MRLRSSLLLTGIILSGTVVQTAGADEFRVDSEVFVDDQPQPVTRSLTIFRGGQVYDFLHEPREVTIFDRPRDRVIVLNLSHRLRTEVPLDRLAAYSDQLQQRASGANSLVDEVLHPRFDVTRDADTGDFAFAGAVLSYRIKPLRPADAEVVDRYREFSDLSARLNSLLNPRAMPPFARLAVNERLASDGVVPADVRLTFAPRGSWSKPVALRGIHRFGWRLLDSDAAKIAEVDEALVKFEAVSLEDYLRRTATPTE